MIPRRHPCRTSAERSILFRATDDHSISRRVESQDADMPRACTQASPAMFRDSARYGIGGRLTRWFAPPRPASSQRRLRQSWSLYPSRSQEAGRARVSSASTTRRLRRLKEDAEVEAMIVSPPEPRQEWGPSPDPRSRNSGPTGPNTSRCHRRSRCTPPSRASSSIITWSKMWANMVSRGMTHEDIAGQRTGWWAESGQIGASCHRPGAFFVGAAVFLFR
jgi:hypothetical protein